MSTAYLDSHNRNLIHALAAKGQPKPLLKCISTTLKRNVLRAVTAKDDAGWTPLHTAAYYGNLKVLKILLDFHPDAADIRDNSGNNVYEALAKFHENAIGPLENMREFRRLTLLDKFELSYPYTEQPMNIWDTTMSSSVIFLIASSNLDSERQLYSYNEEEGQIEKIELENDAEPRYVCSSKTHSLVISDDQCFAWGKNINGVLGFETSAKSVASPGLVDGQFVEYLGDMRSNIFDALDNRTKVIKRPLIGCSCSDDFSCVYTAERVFCWGVNKGQMLGKALKNEVVESPIVIFEGSNNINIRSVKCGEHFIAILTTDDKLSILCNGKLMSVGNNTQHTESIEASGSYLALVNTKGKLVKAVVGEMGTDSVSTIWTPKTEKDKIISYAISELGNVILSTKTSTYKLLDNKAVNEQKSLRGVHITDLKCDPLFKKFIGVHSFATGFGYLDRDRPVKQVQDINYGSKASWEAKQAANIVLKLDNGGFAKVHSAILYARCPTLRSMIIGENIKVVAVPDCSILFKGTSSSNEILVENCDLESLNAFVEQLYLPHSYEHVSFSTQNIHNQFRALKRLITKKLGSGIYEAQTANINCDASLNGYKTYKPVLCACSPVFEAQVERWQTEAIEAPKLSSKRLLDAFFQLLLVEVKDGISTSELHFDSKTLFTLWQTGDELLVEKIRSLCELQLRNMVDFELVIPLVNAIMGYSITRSPAYIGLLDIVARNLPFFITKINEINSDSMDLIEKMFKGLASTSPVDEDLVLSTEKLSLQNRQEPESVVKTPTKNEEPSNKQKPNLASPAKVSAPQATLMPQTPVPKPQEEGWQKAGKKNRTKSQPALEPVIKPLVTPTKPKPVSPPTKTAVSPFSSLPQLGQRKPPSPAPTSAPTPIASTAASPPQPSLGVLSGKKLPTMGQSPFRETNKLPVLGSSPSNQTAKRSKMKFGSKNVKHFSNPLDLAQQINPPKTQDSPWKAVSTQPVDSISKISEQKPQSSAKQQPNRAWRI